MRIHNDIRQSCCAALPSSLNSVKNRKNGVTDNRCDETIRVRVVGGGYRQLFYTKIYLPLLFYDDYFFLVRSTDKKNYKGAK